MECRYLVATKEDHRAVDSVCNFHSKNGAVLAHIHWNADASQWRWQQSYGIMVNYEYSHHHLEEVSMLYKKSGTVSVYANELRTLMSPQDQQVVHWIS